MVLVSPATWLRIREERLRVVRCDRAHLSINSLLKIVRNLIWDKVSNVGIF